MCFGPIAQLGERIVRNDEVVGSIPIWSTIYESRTNGIHWFLYNGNFPSKIKRLTSVRL